MNNNNLKTVALLITAFSIAMALLETSVVVYLRALFYPDGFEFPLKRIPDNLIIVEILREASTIIMLASIGMLVGKDKFSKLAWFLYSFAIWDIFYYIFLFLFIQWPASVLEWDILFLIPLPWYGPVGSPIGVAICMILFAWVLLPNSNKIEQTKIKSVEWGVMLLGCTTILYTYMADFIKAVPNIGSLQSIKETSDTFIPERYNWNAWAIGIFLILLGILSLFNRIRKTNITLF